MSNVPQSRRIRALVADDEPHLARHLSEMLARAWPAVEVVAVAHDGRAAFEAVERLQPDLAFLDIRMPELDGIEVGWLVAQRTRVVYVTAYEEHAVTAFDQGAADYVMKPVTVTRLARTVARLAPLFGGAGCRSSGACHDFVTTLRIVDDARKPRLVRVKDVRYLRACGNLLHVVASSVSGVMRASLTEVLQALDPEHFVQIHRATAVNMRAVLATKNQGHGAVVKLEGVEEELRVSRQFRHQMRERLGV
ncbi:MAG: LytTR family DNA-binding domain-containing protein [Opitutaceae bacterium]|nr:LytTR family DNA-binding domain-containing protein [Opitutaceae bacterium]